MPETHLAMSWRLHSGRRISTRTGLEGAGHTGVEDASPCRMSLFCKHGAVSLVLVKYCIYAMCLYTVVLGDQPESLLIVARRDV